MVRALHERRFVRYINHIGVENEQYCYIQYIGQHHLVLHNGCRDVKIPKENIVKITTPMGRTEYTR